MGNIIDIAVLIAVGYGIFRGFRNGVIYEVAGLLGLIVGVWAGMRLAFLFADWYKENTSVPENWVPLLAFLTAFLLGMGAVYLAGRLITQLVKTVQLNLVNRVAGGAFGALKWALILGSVISMLGTSSIFTPEIRESSRTYPYLFAYTAAVHEYSIGLVPQAENVFEEMDSYFIALDSTRTNNTAE
ncbi:MAG: CvpA family protein [Bacteroidota bacterium]